MGPGSRPLRIGLLLLLAGAGAGAGAWRLAAAAEAQRQAAIETSRVRGWARANTAAGMSVLPKRIPAADPAQLRRLEAMPGFHEYAMRCSSCHVLPDPAAYPAARWAGKVADMQHHTDRSGMMPPPESDMTAATTFLVAASDSLRARQPRTTRIQR